MAPDRPMATGLPSLVPRRLVAVPMLVGLLAEPLAWALALWPGTLDPGWYGRPSLLVAVHLLTVGTLALPILGAGTQLVPVVTNRAPGPGVRRVDAVAGALAVGGAPLLWLGLSGWWTAGAFGAAALLIALLVRQGRVVADLATATGREAVRSWLLGAEGALLAGLLVAAGLYATRSGWPVVRDPIGGVGLHAALLLAGWAGGWVLGLAALLLPMFAVAHEPRPRVYLVAAAAWFGGILLGTPWLWAIGAILAAFELGRVLWSGRRLGVGLGLVGLGLAGLVVTAGLAIAGAPGHVLVVAALALWLVPFEHGVAQRILPFLAWAHELAPGGARAPGVQALMADRPGRVALVTHAIGGPLLVVGVATGSAVTARAGAAALLVASLAQVAVVLTVAGRTVWHRNRLVALRGMEAR